MSMRRVAPPPTHPAVQKHIAMRRERLSNRAADSITTFAGSMVFVYVHVVWFGIWMAINLGLFGKSAEFDKFPFGLLTMAVSLEAIFLSTFVMISQNRADEKRQLLASEEWRSVQLEEQQNEQLLLLSQQILELTDSIHRLTLAHTGAEPGPAGGPSAAG